MLIASFLFVLAIVIMGISASAGCYLNLFIFFSVIPQLLFHLSLSPDFLFPLYPSSFGHLTLFFIKVIFMLKASVGIMIAHLDTLLWICMIFPLQILLHSCLLPLLVVQVSLVMHLWNFTSAVHSMPWSKLKFHLYTDMK
jgi:hypothetical protein